MNVATKKIILATLLCSPVLFILNQGEKYLSVRQTAEALICEHASRQHDPTFSFAFKFIEGLYSPRIKIKMYITENPKKYCIIKFNVTHFREIEELYEAIDEAIDKLISEYENTFFEEEK